MKFLIASDIHGSAFFCQKLMEAWEREGADRMILLGDLLYHGPRNDLPKDYAPKEVAAMLSEIGGQILAVRGNCEAEVDQLMLPFPVMADYALLPLEERLIFITHGHHFNTGNLPPLKEGDILLHGHTHVPAFEEAHGILYLNPGSVSLPKDGSPNAYMILCDGTFFWKKLDGTVYKTWTP